MNLHVLSSICVRMNTSMDRVEASALQVIEERYTFEYTDLVHRCFKHSNSSQQAAVEKRPASDNGSFAHVGRFGAAEGDVGGL